MMGSDHLRPTQQHAAPSPTVGAMPSFDPTHGNLAANDELASQGASSAPSALGMAGFGHDSGAAPSWSFDEDEGTWNHATGPEAKSTLDPVAGSYARSTKAKDATTGAKSTTKTAATWSDEGLALSTGDKHEEKNGDGTAAQTTVAMSEDQIKVGTAQSSTEGGLQKRTSDTGSLGERGMSYDGTRRRGLTQGDQSFSRTLYGELGGGVTLDVALHQRDDGTVQAVTTASVYASVGSGLEAGGSASGTKGAASIGLKGTLKDSLVFTHLLPSAEVNRHIELIQSGDASFVRILLAGLGPDAGVVGPDTAAEIEPGDSVGRTRDISGELAVGAALAKASAHVAWSGGGSMSWLASGTEAGVTVEVMAGATTQFTGKGSLRLGVVTAGQKYSAKDAEFLKLRSRPLDPTRIADRMLLDDLWGARQRDDIEALWASYGAADLQRTEATSLSAATALAAGIGPAVLGQNESSSFTSAVGEGVDGLEAEFTGSHSTAVTAVGRPLSETKNTLTAKAADGEAAMTFESAETLPKSMLLPWEQGRKTLARFNLSHSEVSKCLELAWQAEEWDGCARTVSSHQAWVATGREIRTAQPPHEWTEATSLEFATLVAGLSEIAKFVQGVRDSEHVIYNLVHRFGTPVGDLTSIPGAEDISERLVLLRGQIDHTRPVDEDSSRLTNLASQLELLRDALLDSPAEERWLTWALADIDELGTRIAWREAGQSPEPQRGREGEAGVVLRTMASLHRLELRALVRIERSPYPMQAAREIAAQLPPIYEEWLRSDIRVKRLLPGTAAPTPDLEYLDKVIGRWARQTSNFESAEAQFPRVFSHWSTP